MSRRPAYAALALCASLAAAGCGQEVVEQKDLEREVKDSLTRSVGQAPKAIRCPGDIEAKAEEKVRCVLVAPDDSEVDVDVRVKSVEDGKARFDIQVDDEVRR